MTDTIYKIIIDCFLVSPQIQLLFCRKGHPNIKWRPYMGDFVNVVMSCHPLSTRAAANDHAFPCCLVVDLSDLFKIAGISCSFLSYYLVPIRFVQRWEQTAC